MLVSIKNKFFFPIFMLVLLATQAASALEIGDVAPAFDLEASAGNRIQLNKLNGKLVYLDFWASWCGPCRQSFPWMNAVENKYKDRGLEVLAINLDVKTSDAEKFLSQFPSQFKIAFDPKGVTPKLYNIKAMPTSFLIGRDGKILYQHNGFNTAASIDIERLIDHHLKEK